MAKILPVGETRDERVEMLRKLIDPEGNNDYQVIEFDPNDPKEREMIARLNPWCADGAKTAFNGETSRTYTANQLKSIFASADEKKAHMKITRT